MKWILVGLAGLVALALAITIVGVLLPEDHEASRSVHVVAPPEEVFALITDFEDAPRWRSDVETVEVFEEAGTLRVRETGSFGPILYEVVERREPTRLVTRIADESLPFGGIWTYELEPEAGGTRLTITERGFVRNPIFRFVSRFVMGHESTLIDYLDAVESRFDSRR